MEKPTSTTEPTELTFKCNQYEIGLKILNGNAHKSAQQKTPEKECSDVEEPTLILTPLKVTGREEKEDTSTTENIIDCEVKESVAKVSFFCPFCTEDDGYCHCGHCQVCETMLSEVVLNMHIMNDYDLHQVYSHFGRDWVLGNKHLFDGTHDLNYI